VYPYREYTGYLSNRNATVLKVNPIAIGAKWYRTYWRWQLWWWWGCYCHKSICRIESANTLSLIIAGRCGHWSKGKRYEHLR